MGPAEDIGSLGRINAAKVQWNYFLDKEFVRSMSSDEQTSHPPAYLYHVRITIGEKAAAEGELDLFLLQSNDCSTEAALASRSTSSCSVSILRTA